MNQRQVIGWITHPNDEELSGPGLPWESWAYAIVEHLSIEHDPRQDTLAVLILSQVTDAERGAIAHVRQRLKQPLDIPPEIAAAPYNFLLPAWTFPAYAGQILDAFEATGQAPRFYDEGFALHWTRRRRRMTESG